MLLPTADITLTDPIVNAVISLSRLLADTGLIGIVGALTLVLVLPNHAGVLTSLQRDWLARARGFGALVWVATALWAVATTADVLALSLPQALANPNLVMSLLTQTALGKSLAFQLVAAALIAITVAAPRKPTTVLLALVLPLAIIIARASTGHSGNSSWHMAAIEGWVLHISAVSVWVGAVSAAIWHLRTFSADATLLVRRLHPVAAVCFTTVVISGAINAVIRVSHVSDLVTTTYGRLVSIKILALAVIAGLALRVRGRQLAARALGLGTFLRRELLLMAVAISASVVLARTAPPVDPDADALALPTPARLALGFPLPPAPNSVNLVWAVWRPEVLWLTLAVAATLTYVAGVRRLTSRGDYWSRGRTFAWIAGWAVITYSTSGPLGVYGHVLFSAHMVQHLLLVMVGPILLVCGAPTTLALRALPAASVRAAGRDSAADSALVTGESAGSSDSANPPNSTGPREWLLAALHSRYLSILGHPLVAFANFVAGFFVLYFSVLFQLLMSSHAGHLLMQVHFIATGYLFFWALIGVDPSPRRVPEPVKVGLAILAAPFHALFSVIIMQSDVVLARDYFTIFTAELDTHPLKDQYTGAAFGWAFGEVPMVAVIVIAVVHWVRADARAAARFDRLDDARREANQAD